MNSVNSITITGLLGREPELRHVGANNTAVCEFSIAVTESRKVGSEWEDKTSWVPIVVWQRQAEWCSENLSKGAPVLVVGRIQEEAWEKDGVKRSKLNVVAETVRLMAKVSKSESRRDKAEDGSWCTDETPF